MFLLIAFLRLPGTLDLNVIPDYTDNITTVLYKTVSLPYSFCYIVLAILYYISLKLQIYITIFEIGKVRITKKIVLMALHNVIILSHPGKGKTKVSASPI
jgi:hypothetical protein